MKAGGWGCALPEGGEPSPCAEDAIAVLSRSQFTGRPEQVRGNTAAKV